MGKRQEADRFKAMPMGLATVTPDYAMMGHAMMGHAPKGHAMTGRATTNGRATGRAMTRPVPLPPALMAHAPISLAPPAMGLTGCASQDSHFRHTHARTIGVTSTATPAIMIVPSPTPPTPRVARSGCTAYTLSLPR
jgi:hypothetical protein